MANQTIPLHRVTSPSTTKQNFATSGTARLIIDDAGKIGIGTTSPAQRLHVSSGSGASTVAQFGEAYDTYVKIKATNTASAMLNFMNAADTTVWSAGFRNDSGDGPFRIRKAATLDSGGHRHDFGADGSFNVIPNNAAAKISIQASASGNDSELRFDTALNGRGIYLDDSATNALKIYTGHGKGTSGKEFTIDNDGKVGILNTTPATNHSKANNLVVGSGSAGGMAVWSGTAEGWYAFSRGNANNSDAYDGGMSYNQGGDRILRFHTNAGSTRMLITAAGAVGINRTPSISNCKLEIGGADNVNLMAVEASGMTLGLGCVAGTGTNRGGKIFLGTSARFTINSAGNISYTPDGLFGGPARPNRWVSTGSGELLLGYKDHGSGLYSAAMALAYDAIDGLSNTAYVDGFLMRDTGNGTTHLVIETDGDIKNTNNSYGSLSDERIKKDIADASSQWDDIKALKIRKYKLATQPAPYNDKFQIGVIAQELEAAGMNGLIKESDPDTKHLEYDSSLVGQKVKSVKYSVLHMKALKALQEAMTRIETLEAKVATLEG